MFIMDNKNKMLFALLVLSAIIVFAGVMFKLEGQENASLFLMSGIGLKVVSVIALVSYNFSRIKSIFK